MVMNMSMKKIHADVQGLVDKELALANNNHPAFNSTHEGYAVIREEWKEHRREAEDLESWIELMEDAVFGNADASKYVDAMEETAIKAACEAIQIAAMCRKFKEGGIVL